MARRSVRFPVTLGFVLSALALVLAVGWVLVLFSDRAVADTGLTSLDWVLLVLGIALFALIIVGLAWLCAWLVREMRLNQRQHAFLDAVTHEMKTPLASLRLYLETMVKHDPPLDRRSAFLARMAEDLERLDETVDQVLAAARAEEPGRYAKLQDVALTKLLGPCIEEVRERHTLPVEAVSLVADPQAIVRADPSELALVFRNLLENAVKYSDDPGEVRVAVSNAVDGRVRIDISDRGIGIPVRELRKIFQRFYRVGRDVQRTASGLGLGLFIVRNLVRRQGGRVVARSEGRGEGSRFVVTLQQATGPSPDAFAS